MNRHVIIGTGVAGISAVEALRTFDPSAEITLVGEDPHGFYSRPGLAYYLTGEVPEKQLYIFNQQDWRALKIRFVKASATRILPHEHRLELGPAGALTYDRLLLATGASAARLRVAGADLRGVVKLDHFEDARTILALARRARAAVVVGGGVIAVELVEGLVKQGVRVHYFLRGDRYWSNVLDPVESRLIESRLHDEGVQLHHRTELDEILGRGGKVTGVRTKNGETIRCGLVAVGIGVYPRQELAQASGLATGRGVLTDATLQTSAPDIFAAGDVAQVQDPSTGASSSDTLWYPARQQGRVAGQNMAGQHQLYERGVAVNILRLAGVMTTIIGAVGEGRDEDLVSVARGSSEAWQQLPNSIATEASSGVNHLRLMVGEKTLHGAVVMGEQKLSRPLQELIGAQTDITSLRSDLLEPGAQLGEAVMNLWSRMKGGDH